MLPDKTHFMTTQSEKLNSPLCKSMPVTEYSLHIRKNPPSCPLTALKYYCVSDTTQLQRSVLAVERLEKERGEVRRNEGYNKRYKHKKGDEMRRQAGLQRVEEREIYGEMKMPE